MTEKRVHHLGVVEVRDSFETPDPFATHDSLRPSYPRTQKSASELSAKTLAYASAQDGSKSAISGTVYLSVRVGVAISEDLGTGTNRVHT